VIYHGDCRDIIPQLSAADLSPDLLVLDPPFDLWPDVPYIMAKTTLAFTNRSSRATVQELLGEPRTEVIWHFRDGRWVSHQLPLITHETILVFGALNDMYLGEEQAQVPQRIAPHRHLQRTRTPRTSYVPKPRRALNSVLEFPQNPGTEPLGRWSKPAGLMRLLLEWAATGPYVLDPFMGGGTTLKVARDLGLPAIGIEIEERYCEVAVELLSQQVLDLV
jgi:DNA modification methylase